MAAIMISHRTNFQPTVFFLATVSFSLCLFSPSPLEARCKDDAEPGVNWTGCLKGRRDLSSHNMKGARLDRSILTGSDMARANLHKANLDGADLTYVSFLKADLGEATFNKAFGMRVSMEGARMQNAVLDKAEFFRVNLSGADLKGASARKAQLARGNFADAQLIGTDLSFSNVARAKFAGAHIEDVNLQGAYMYLTRLEGVDLSSAKGLEQLQVNLACGDDKTVLPSGLQRPASWPCKFDASSDN